MENFLAWYEEVGLAITIIMFLGAFVAYLIKHILTESKERETSLTESLTRITETIEKSNEVNHQLSETNRMLVEKMEGKLETIEKDVNEILIKIEKE